MLFNVWLPVFIIAPFLPWSLIGMLLHLVSCVNYLMVKAVIIYSHCSLPLPHLSLEDPPPVLAICWILFLHLDCKIPSYIFKSLDCYRQSWCGAIPSLWNNLPADLYLRGHLQGWHSMLKDLQCCCCR